MNADKLLKLVRNVRDLKYPIDSLSNSDEFEKELASDLSTTPEEALAMLGYLLARNYVRIIPDAGIVVNPGNEEIQAFVRSGKLDAE